MQGQDKGGQSWLTLEAAIAWVITRDPAFTEQVQQTARPRRPSTLLPGAEGEWGNELPSGLPADLKRPAIHRPAWVKLRSAISAGKVRARGTQGQNEGEIVDASLLAVVGGFRFSLATETYPLTPFQPWTRVLIIQNDLLRAFPPAQTGKAPFTARHGKGRKVDSVTEALEFLANKNGGNLPTQWDEQTRWDKVRGWLQSGSYPEVSTTTLKDGYRIFQQRRKST
jgi:hypothetical protein